MGCGDPYRWIILFLCSGVCFSRGYPLSSTTPTILPTLTHTQPLLPTAFPVTLALIHKSVEKLNQYQGSVVFPTLHNVDKNKRYWWAFCSTLGAPTVGVPYYLIRTKIESTPILWHYRQNSLTPLSYIDIYISFLAQEASSKSEKQLFGLWSERGSSWQP